MGQVFKINPYTKKTMPVDEPIEVPFQVKEYIKHCDVVTDISPEDARRLRLENIRILNEIVNDVTVSATTRVQAVQVREKILKDLMGNVGMGNQRSLEDLKSLLSDDEEDADNIEGPIMVPGADSDEIDSDSRQISVEEIKQQMLDETEE